MEWKNVINIPHFSLEGTEKKDKCACRIKTDDTKLGGLRVMRLRLKLCCIML